MANYLYSMPKSVQSISQSNLKNRAKISEADENTKQHKVKQGKGKKY